MSDLLKHLADYVGGLPNADVHVVLGASFGEDEQAVLAAAVPEQRSAELEGRRIDAVALGEARPGRFAFFMDGAQRTRGPIYIDSSVPIMYACVAAAIRLRAERRMRARDYRMRESLYFPHRMIDPAPLHRAGIETIDSGEGDYDLEQHPIMLVERAKKKISDARSVLESNVASEWLAEFDGRDEWLLVDGSLCGGYERYESPNIVGVVKSHQTQYFPWEDQRKILSLGMGERSGVFVPLGRKRPKVYSWYVRLHPNDGRDVYFGLVRVEAARCERTLEMADEISRWLLAERSPLSMPDSRWDKMIYPIRDCEQYLKSIAPSHVSLDAMMIRLTRQPSLCGGNSKVPG